MIDWIVYNLPYLVCFLALLALMQIELKRVWDRLSLLVMNGLVLHNVISEYEASNISTEDRYVLKRDIIFLTQQLTSVRNLAFAHSTAIAKLEAAKKKRKR